MKTNKKKGSDSDDSTGALFEENKSLKEKNQALQKENDSLTVQLENLKIEYKLITGLKNEYLSKLKASEKKEAYMKSKLLETEQKLKQQLSKVGKFSSTGKSFLKFTFQSHTIFFKCDHHVFNSTLTIFFFYNYWFGNCR